MPLRVLVVEDEASTRQLYGKILSSAGTAVSLCGSGDDAIRLLDTEPFDVVLLDYGMPGVTGINVLQWMYGRKLDIPVILITGYPSEDLEFEAVKWGIYEYLIKGSFSPDQLPAIVTRANAAHRPSKRQS